MQQTAFASLQCSYLARCSDYATHRVSNLFGRRRRSEHTSVLTIVVCGQDGVRLAKETDTETGVRWFRSSGRPGIGESYDRVPSSGNNRLREPTRSDVCHQNRLTRRAGGRSVLSRPDPAPALSTHRPCWTRIGAPTRQWPPCRRAQPWAASRTTAASTHRT